MTYKQCVMYLLSCVAGFMICVGFVVAVILGVAYGYNYAMAEFYTLATSRTDINVYMKRGKFLDDPQFGPKSRRSGGDGMDMVEAALETPNLSSDENQAVETDRRQSVQLSDQWNKRDEGRRYMEKITVKPLAVSLYTFTGDSDKLSTDYMAVIPAVTKELNKVKIITYAPVFDNEFIQRVKQPASDKAIEKIIMIQTDNPLDVTNKENTLLFAEEWDNIRPTVSRKRVTLSRRRLDDNFIKTYQDKEEGRNVQPLAKTDDVNKSKDFEEVERLDSGENEIAFKRRKTLRPHKQQRKGRKHKSMFIRPMHRPTARDDNFTEY